MGGKVVIIQRLFLCCAISILWVFPVNAGIWDRPTKSSEDTKEAKEKAAEIIT